MAYQQSLHAVAARLYVDALEAEPSLAADRRTQHSYNAAYAALAGCGQGKDDPSPDESARAGLRRQAQDWLRAELATWAKLLEDGPPQARSIIAQTLKHWQVDPDLIGIRDAGRLAGLPESEASDWRALWADVAQIRHRAEQPALASRPPQTAPREADTLDTPPSDRDFPAWPFAGPAPDGFSGASH